MNIYDKRVKSAQNLINFSSILRLCGIAALAFFWASSYSYPSNLMKIYKESSHLIVVILGLALDVFLTVNWLKSPKLFKLHLKLYIFLGGIFYYIYSLDLLNSDFDDIWGSFAAIISTVFIWVLGLVPFIICGVNNNDLAKAEAEQRYWKEKAEKEQAAQSAGDNNEHI